MIHLADITHPIVCINLCQLGRHIRIDLDAEDSLNAMGTQIATQTPITAPGIQEAGAISGHQVGHIRTLPLEVILVCFRQINLTTLHG